MLKWLLVLRKENFCERNFFNYGLYMVWGLALIESVLTILFFMDFHKKKGWLIFLMGVLSFSMAYDAIIIGIGVFTAEPILRVFSRMRFVNHGLLVPLNLMVCSYAMYWRGKKKTFAWILTIALMILGTVAGIKREIDTMDFAGMIRFVSVSPDGSWTEIVSKLFSFGTILPVIATGIYLTVRFKQPEFLIAGILMFAFSALAPATGNADLTFLISMFGEMFMLLFYLIYEKKYE